MTRKTTRYLHTIRFGCMFFLFTAIGAANTPAHAEQQTAYDYVVTDSEYTVDSTDSISDYKGIQDTLNKAIGSNRIITIYFPAGDYYLDKSLWIYSNTHIILDKNATIHRMDSMINKGMMHNVDQNSKMDATGGYDMSKNIIIEGGTWDGGNTALASKSSDIIRIDHASNVTIKDCTIKNVYDCHLVELVGVQNGLVNNCTFTGFRYAKGHEKDYTYAREALQLDSAWLNWAIGSVVDGTSCKQVMVTNNSFKDMPCGVGQHHHTKTGECRNEDITISSNTFTCSSSMKYCKMAVNCCGMNNLNVVDNTIDGPYRFSIHVIASNNVSITKNKISNILINGMKVDSGSTITIKENTFKSIGRHGISIQGGDGINVTNNNITKVKENGICIYGGKFTNIANNTITDAGNHGISVAKSKGITPSTIKNINKNKITKVKQNGISISAGKVTNVNQNTIKTAGNHGISVIGGTVGSGKKKNVGIQKNTISSCKQNGVTVSIKGTVSSIGSNKITGVKNNGISLTGKAKVYWIVNNTLKKCSKHGVWNGLDKNTVKMKGNKGKLE